MFKKSAPGTSGNSKAAQAVAAEPVNDGMSPEVEQLVDAGSGRVVRKLIIANMISMSVAAVSLLVAGGGLFLAARNQVVPVAVSESGTIVPLIPLSERYIGDEQVASFSGECARKSLTHSFLNLQDSMLAASKCFTSQGWKDFAGKMDPLLLDVKSQRGNLVALVRTPGITKSGKTQDGTFAWMVETVATLSVEGPQTRTAPREYLIKMTVVRVPLSESLTGLKLASLNTSPYSANN